MSYGHCPPDQLCDVCLAQALATHSGTARRRGETWLEERRRANAVPATEADRELLEATARGKMRDVASDERLLEQLAAITLRYALPELH